MLPHYIIYIYIYILVRAFVHIINLTTEGASFMVTVPAVIVYDQILVPGRNDRSFVYIINSIRVRSRLYIRAYYLLFYGDENMTKAIYLASSEFDQSADRVFTVDLN